MNFLIFTIALATSAIQYHTDPNDIVEAEYKNYMVITHVEDQSGIDYLCRKDGPGEILIIAYSDDIHPVLEKMVPHDVALNLETQMAKKEIDAAGGAAKVQAESDADLEKNPNYYNYLTPLFIQAYAANGVYLTKH